MPVTPLSLDLTAAALKCSIVLTPAALIGVHVPDGTSRATLRVTVEGRTLVASVAAKSLRRAIATVGTAGPENVALVLQGRLVGDTIEDAGVAALPKPAKVEKAAVSNGQGSPLHAG